MIKRNSGEDKNLITVLIRIWRDYILMNIELEKLLECNGLNDEKNIIINFVEGLFKIAFTMCVKEDNNDKL